MKIYFSGIGGTGMSSLALFMADKGHEVEGSDRAFKPGSSHPVYAALCGRGIRVVPQDGSRLDRTTDLAVFSTAVEKTSPDYIKALTLGINIKTRPQLLADIVREYQTIAVAGTSGKSTTSGMLAYIMRRIGMEPNFIGGGRVKQFITGANAGNYLSGPSRRLVIEACESDGSIIDYLPEYSIIMNLALDHHDIDTTKEMFRILIKNTRTQVFINSDDPNTADLAAGLVRTFSLDSPSCMKPLSYALHDLWSEMVVRDTKFRINIPGRHNLYNALSCVAYLESAGADLKNVADAASGFRGIERRFDIHLNAGGKLVIDDYAHNPHKIDALMQSVSSIRENVCYIFQPLGYSPTRLMLDGYIESFVANLRHNDMLALLPIYYAGGSVQTDVSSEDIASGVRLKGKNAAVFADRVSLLDAIKEWSSIVVLGARDETLSTFAADVADAISE